MEIKYILDIVYLIASVTFVIGLKMLSHPDTARRGNLYAAFGMTLAIAGTILWYNHPDGYTSREPLKIILILAAIGIGTVAGWLTANKVQMTKMPELVSLFNGMGGACAALIGIMEYEHNIGNTGALATIIAGMIIGSVSFSGSIIAFLKLNETMKKPVRLPSYNILNTIIMVALIVFGIYIVYAQPEHMLLPVLLFVSALIYGVLFVIPIGGADMPVVISLLNSFTGLAAAFGGFLYQNQVMLTGGILVGSAGTILTLAMCKAMNRPLSNVIFGAFGGGGASAAGNDVKGSIKDISISDTAILMNYAKKVVIVPGYGLAVAQAQHVIHELETLLEERGVNVEYAIHPVAGRMPGHMNVLLAESNVSYDKLVEMEDINPEFAKTDVVLVVGANDVVNPAAKTDPSSPIFGMPILDVENAHNVIVNKRSMNAGYAGIDNLLFYQPKTSMLFGDAKGVLTKLVSELKQM
ncbi:NAD(P)(+) transhydrogenase (Re/Si-specific) subunit beta [Emticicia sp. BO119]|uniref:NAD(P)(+) transhydrogenase (Re/Si-specific) subunit beta n=1 Tax=Emticicia sp. BO119 TaxID=2757768 RepID=UPI0015F08AF5|nr:NAD(P)(+) transhydrogenase (Re/Si-specific) subunit beta [Emticicia sp. BO119]MBA4850922.1 NAD(P)(+) transhydrogenase (Re/Si-specific) subunit beta [Emticicia sp. BO119]